MVVVGFGAGAGRPARRQRRLSLWDARVGTAGQCPVV